MAFNLWHKPITSALYEASVTGTWEKKSNNDFLKYHLYFKTRHYSYYLK